MTDKLWDFITFVLPSCTLVAGWFLGWWMRGDADRGNQS